MSARFALALGLVIACAVGAAAVGQDLFGRRRDVAALAVDGTVEYDGRLTFARVQFTAAFRGGFGRRGSFGEPPWAHDYPTADVHLMRIMKELTLADARTDGSNVVKLDDPALFSFPIAYVSEPGYWAPTEAEAAGLRSYLLKGGLVIFDDFREAEGDWHNLREQMRRVLPALRFLPLDERSPVFNSFFEIRSLDWGYYGPGQYFGLFEDNDPRKRMMAIAGVNQDLGEYWEFSDTGLVPIDLSNEAYKFGVNYFIYGLTH